LPVHAWRADGAHTLSTELVIVDAITLQGGYIPVEG
jgi:hypothetical protein